jgi:catechol 2,3-dioxygenase
MSIHPETTIGHIHLTVANLERSLAFYRDILGFDVVTTYGDSAVFLSAGGYHHHIGLNTWSGSNIEQANLKQAGLYHFAILLPSRVELAKVVQRIMEANYPLEGASDHGVSEAIYLKDPDNIGVELYVDRPTEQWPKDTQGNLEMFSKPLDINNVLAELSNP